MDFWTSFTSGSAPATINKNESLYRNHMLGLIETSTLPEMLLIWNQDNLSPRTIRSLLNIYKAWYKFKYEKLPPNYNNIIRKLTRLESNDPKRVWSVEEINKALSISYIVNKDYYYKILFTLNTGVRKGEMFNIKAKDFDLKKKKIKVYGSKTGQIRYIPLPPHLENILAPLISKMDLDDTVFPGRNVNRVLAYICKLAGVKLLSWHGLRHTFATSLLEAKVSPRKVAKLLGHKRVSTTLDMYWHLQDEDVDLSALPKGVTE